MKVADTISVNPGKDTLGHVENTSSIFRNPVLGVKSSHSVNLLNVVLPSSKLGLTELSKYDVPMRTIFATILIVTGITMLEMHIPTLGIGFAVCSLCFGAFLAIGLFTRPVMLGAAVYYCITGALALRGGMVDMTTFTLMFGCLLFSLTGAGKYSCDNLLRVAIKRQRMSSKRKHRETMMSYKAFHNINL